MEIFCEGIIHPIQVDDMNYYNISNHAEVIQLLQVTSLESEDTKKEINHLIHSSTMIAIANTGSQTLMLKVSLLSSGKILIYNKKKGILLKATV